MSAGNLQSETSGTSPPAERTTVGNMAKARSASFMMGDLVTRRSSGAKGILNRDRKRKLTIQRGDGEMTETQFEEQQAQESFFRVVIDGDEGGLLLKSQVQKIQDVIKLREHYMLNFAGLNAFAHLKRPILRHGVYIFPDDEKKLAAGSFYGSPNRPWQFYAKDVEKLLFTVENTNCRKACDHRLGIIQERSRMFFSLNTDIEADIMDIEPCSKAGGVFSTATKVDNSVRLSKLMNAQELLEFIQKYHQRFPNEVVGKGARGGNVLLKEVFDEYGLTNPKDLTVTGLDWHTSTLDVDDADMIAQAQSAYASDRMGSAGSGGGRPGSSQFGHRPSVAASALEQVRRGKKQPLGSVLQKYFASLKGLPFPLVLKEVLKKRDDKSSRYIQGGEYKISVYGASKDELEKIAHFFWANDVGPYERAKWVLHLKFIERVSQDDFMGTGTPYANCKTLQDQLDNIFGPLIGATMKPEEHRTLAWFLPQVGAIHLESLRASDEEFEQSCPPPDEIPFNMGEGDEDEDEDGLGGMMGGYGSNEFDGTNRDNDIARMIETQIVRKRAANTLSELYYDYYVWANLCTLNQLRDKKGLDPIQLRRGGGEGVGINSLLGGYLLSDMVSNGGKLADHPVLQYLYGMHRIGVTLSPLYDDQRQKTPYSKTPISTFLHRSIRVTLCTEEPLHLHTNYDSLVEEYGTAQKLCRLNPLDMTELARNSVLMSTFSRIIKEDWLGPRFNKKGNNPKFSQVSNARLEFREEVWNNEKEILTEIARQKAAQQKGIVATTVESATANLSSVKDVQYFQVLDSRIRFPRTVICGPQERDITTSKAAPLIRRAVELRGSYVWQPPEPWFQRHDIVEEAFQAQTASFNENDWCFAAIDSIICPFPVDAAKGFPKHIRNLKQFHQDFTELKSICDSIEVKDFANRRLELLESKFRLHLALNHANEAGSTDQKASSNRDLYHSYKVDTHVHMAAGMTARALRDFIAEKIRNHPDDVVMENKEKKTVLTLESLMNKYNITAETLTTDQLNVHADHTLFERFDNFNNKYNPMAIQDLRTLLLKTENFMNGRYFAELIQNTFDGFTKDRYTFAENRLSIYGSKKTEWQALADWFATHGMASKHNKWIIQVPRVTYTVFHNFRAIASFGDYLRNLFEPLWEASLWPSKHPRLHHFLNHVAGFDSVDNEATFDAPFPTVLPEQWRTSENPPYGYHMYHLWANIRTLNEFRSFRGFPPLAFRPHCGESGADDHLLYTYLTADAINHGVNLRNDPSVQYLYYVSQIGLAVSPLSNNALFLYFLKNPFPDFFRRGLNVSLSTDDPLMFHQTSEPLIEEYSIAAKVWGLSQNDLCEIARNSVLQSGFDPTWKKNAIGSRYFMSSSLGNDPNKTHLSDIRVSFRFETYHTEVSYLETVCPGKRPFPRKMYTAQTEQEVVEHQLSQQVETVLLSTHDQKMEVITRDLEAKDEAFKEARQKLELTRKQNAAILDEITEKKRILEQIQAEQEEQERRRKLAPIEYQKTTKREQAQQLMSNEISREELQQLLTWQPKPPAGGEGASTGGNTSSGGTAGRYSQPKLTAVSAQVNRPLPLPPGVDGGNRRRVGSARAGGEHSQPPKHEDRPFSAPNK